MSFNKKNITLLSNINFEPYIIPALRDMFGDEFKIEIVQYGEHRDKRCRELFLKSEMIISWLNFECLFPHFFNQILGGIQDENAAIEEATSLCDIVFSEISLKEGCKVIWVLFEDYYCKLANVLGKVTLCNGIIDKINLKIENDLGSKGNVSFLQLKYSIAKIGISEAFDSKGKYRWNAPYSKMLIQDMVKEIHKQYQVYHGITKKCLILDCDNVLWGGILSEDGIQNIKLGNFGWGREFLDFQLFILSLYYQGVIIAICSKNDIADVLNVFNKHSDMVLKECHIACFQVNWNNKPDNIVKIAEKLKIDLHSMVFVDDSIIEVEAVNAMLPEVTTVLYNRNTIYNQLACFNLRKNINLLDVEQRNETYKTNELREQLKTKYKTYEEYISALNMKIIIKKATEIELSRISELTQRANKCTNGRRYTVEQLKEKMNIKYKLYYVSVSDRYSDLGLVGAIGVEGNTLDLFVLSCRALGRNIEDTMIDYITNDSIDSVYKKSTNRNNDILSKLDKLVDCKTIS